MVVIGVTGSLPLHILSRTVAVKSSTPEEEQVWYM